MYKIAVIGVGHWGINYIRNFLLFPQVSEVVCFDNDSKKLEKVKVTFPHVKIASSFEEILNNRDINCVVISTPANTHYELTYKALQSNKHVLCEKPFTLEVEEGQELIKIAKSKQLTLMIAHTFLYNNAIRWIKEFIDKGEVGQLYYLQSVRTHLGLIREDVSVLWDLVPHDISIFSYFLNSTPIQVSAIGGKYLHQQKEDAVFINLKYPNNVIANIQASWMDANKVRNITIVGSQARVLFNDLDNLERVKIFEKGISIKPTPDYGEFQFQLRDGKIVSPKIDMQEPLKAQCAHFLDCVKNNQTPFTDGNNGVMVTKVLKAIERSIKLNGVPQEL